MYDEVLLVLSSDTELDDASAARAEFGYGTGRRSDTDREGKTGGNVMAREQFQTLTEPMYYILLALTEECCGVDIMEKVRQISGGNLIS